MQREVDERILGNFQYDVLAFHGLKALGFRPYLIGAGIEVGSNVDSSVIRVESARHTSLLVGYGHRRTLQGGARGVGHGAQNATRVGLREQGKAGQQHQTGTQSCG